MLVRRKVAVKAIVTGEYKDRLIAQLKQALAKVELSLQELELQGRRYLSEVGDADPGRRAAFGERLERQIRRQQQIRGSLSGRLATVRELEIGTEHTHTVLDSFVEIDVGDNLAQKLTAAELVVKDDLVVEIRNA